MGANDTPGGWRVYDRRLAREVSRNRRSRAIAMSRIVCRLAANCGRPRPYRMALPMRPLEQQLERRYPQWFSGRRAGLTRPLLKTLGRWSRFDEIGEFLERNGSTRDFEFVTAATGCIWWATSSTCGG